MQLILKQFRAWFRQARALHKSSHAVPLVSVGDIWWIAMGDNIGSEINGKNSKHHTEFSRPGIIYKKLSHSLYLIVPTTSGHKEGSWWCNLKFKGKDMAACLHQIRVIDYRRLYDDMGKLRAHPKLFLYFAEPYHEPHHAADHGHDEERHRHSVQTFVVLGQAAATTEPPECPFHDPAFRQQREALGLIAPFYYLKM
jgi:mRNA-degrading endonuclease toxin of MazEF toxin-antitoxin module